MTKTFEKNPTLSQVSSPPECVAIIMDGNGRWASRRGQPRVEGHRRGADIVRDITEYCREEGVRTLYLYAFSEQNWDRPAAEVSALMDLLEEYLYKEIPTMVENGIKLSTVGDIERLPSKVRVAGSEAKVTTAHCREMDLILALSYGGREEIVRAFERYSSKGKDPAKMTIDDLGKNLDTAPYGDPDILLRTGGEKRLSNFLLWQSSYTELFFTDTLWPDFTREELGAVFQNFHARQRRFGRTPDQLAEMQPSKVKQTG